MIRFLLTRGHGWTLKAAPQSRQAPTISLMNYDALIRARWLRRATYIFADLERLSFWDLELASHLYLQLKNAGLNVYNNPAKVKTRYALLRALHTAGVNDFNAYRVDEIDSVMRFPVFLRKLHDHAGALSDLLHTQEDLENATDAAINSGTPGENLMVIEFAAEPAPSGLYRKLTAFRIGGAIVPGTWVGDTLWHVKYGKLGIAGEAEFQEELRMVQTNPFPEYLQRVFDIAGVDYGRADFGFYRGKIQVYEIDTNPCVGPAFEHPSATRVASMRLAWEKYLQALSAIDAHSPGWPIRLADKNALRHHSWKNLFDRSRAVP
jgi:hypothetical protein